MFREESCWIKDVLAGVKLNSASKVLDIGASDIEYRTVTQSHIHENIHKPLLDKGAVIKFLDIKNHDGVDIVIDLASNSLPDSCFSEKFDLIICCNILEHIEEREQFLKNLLRFSRPGTLVMVSVPRVFPKHNDPIDTMYRPTIRELLDFIGVFAKCRVVDSNELVIAEKSYYELIPGRKLDYLLLRAPRMLFRWYLKPLRWKVTCVLLEIQENL